MRHPSYLNIILTIIVILLLLLVLEQRYIMDQGVVFDRLMMKASLCTDYLELKTPSYQIPYYSKEEYEQLEQKRRVILDSLKSIKRP